MEVEVAKMEVAETSGEGKEAEDETDTEAAQVKDFSGHGGLLGLRIEDLGEAIDKIGGFEDGLEEKEAAAGVVVAGKGEEGVSQRGVTAEAFRTGDEPEVELVLEGTGVREEGGAVAFGVVDEVAGVDLEEAREQEAGGVGEVGAGSGLDLGDVGLGQGGSGVRLDGADELLLGHGAVEAAEGSLHLTEIAKFVRELHIAMRNMIITYCD
jgi:hypothetical protein